MLAADLLVERVQQHLLQHAAVDRELRPRVAGGGAAWLAPDLTTVARAVHEARRLDRPAAERRQDAERVELAHRVREQVDADTEGLNAPHPLVHVDAQTDLVKAERGHQAADAGADHDDARCRAPPPTQTISWTSMRTVSRRRSPVDTARRSFIQASRADDVDRRTWVRK